MSNLSTMRTRDPITLEVVKNALSSLADEMALVIMQIGRASCRERV